MSETNTTSQQMVTELKVSAHLMLLNTGLYCVYHAPGSTEPDGITGLPGARITLPPGPTGQGVTISGFREDGWLGRNDTAALIRVTRGPAQVLMTVYQMPGSPHEAPKLQVLRLFEGVAAPVEQAQPVAQLPAAEPKDGVEGDEATVEGGAGGDVPEPEISAHIQMRGDVLARVGEWVGEPGSKRWVEGFALAPRSEVVPSDIEYQAVLGRGWLSPWAEGGQYCGSRGMALPILGMRVRLRGEAAETHRIELYASFTDGTEVGPVPDGEPCESTNLAPLEAFRVKLIPLSGVAAGEDDVEPEETQARKPARRAAAPKAKPAAATPAPRPAPKPAPAAKPARPVVRPVVARTPAKPAAGKPGKGRR